ncbi:MAG: hypothetical protein ACTH2Y_12400 [Corynebacterium sp.]|uniref:hypothetical protein n=1 Tax=unclassified Corynebacterium TaxID=2624378 RepID=UPI003F90B9A7
MQHTAADYEYGRAVGYRTAATEARRRAAELKASASVTGWLELEALAAELDGRAQEAETTAKQVAA